MTTNTQNKSDHSKKSVLARACDPTASFNFANIVPPLIGHAVYVPSTDDTDFIKKLETRNWSVVFFAPGACRLSDRKRQIPGSNDNTKNWTIDEYKVLVRKLQGDDVQIVETVDERESVELLNVALAKARVPKNL